VVSTGGCGAAMKRYGSLLGTAQGRAFAALVTDVHELLAAHEPRATYAPLNLRAAYHEACQLRYAQRIELQPRQLLERIPGLTLLELPPDAGACCGAPGTYAQTLPEAAAELGSRQASAIIAARAQLVVSADHACITQLSRQLEARGRPLPAHHPIELLWRSIGMAHGR
jgi:glycolate oxidase iron-sulfur subunit